MRHQWSSKTFIIVKNRKFYSLSWNKLVRLIIFFHMLFDIDALDFVSFRSFSFSFFYFFFPFYIFVVFFFFIIFLVDWVYIFFFTQVIRLDMVKLLLNVEMWVIWFFLYYQTKLKTYVIRELVNFQYLCYLNYRNWQ